MLLGHNTYKIGCASFFQKLLEDTWIQIRRKFVWNYEYLIRDKKKKMGNLDKNSLPSFLSVWFDCLPIK